MIPRSFIRLTAYFLFISMIALTATRANGQSPDPKLNGFDQFVSQQIKELSSPASPTPGRPT